MFKEMLAEKEVSRLALTTNVIDTQIVVTGQCILHVGKGATQNRIRSSLSFTDFEGAESSVRRLRQRSRR